MIYLLDASVCSDLMHERTGTIAHLNALQDDHAIITCSIIVGEILFGIQRLPWGRRREQLESKANELFSRIACKPVTLETANYYSLIKIARQQIGRGMAENDVWIAASAMTLGAILVTRDSDFDNIDGLSVENWSVVP